MDEDKQRQPEAEISSSEPPEPSFYREEAEPDSPVTEPGENASPQEVSWTASEYIAHHKNFSWYLLLGTAATLAAAFVYWINRDVLTVVAIVVVSVAFGFFGSRQPRTLQYKIDRHGITIGDKVYPYSILRTFSVQQEGAINSISLIPLKRFMPAISVYYPPDQEKEILDTLSSYLPHEERGPDPIDRLMHRLRF